MKKIDEFIKYVKENSEVAAEIKAFASKLKAENPNGIDENTRNTVIETKLIPFAKKYGYELTLEDFEVSEEVSIDEASAVAGGGGGCACVFAGGGGGTEDGKTKGNEGGKTYGCACAMYGQGGNGEADDANCLCFTGGMGTDDCDALHPFD